MSAEEADKSKEEDRYIPTRDYANKYGLDKRKIAPACREDAFIAERRTVPDSRRKGSTTIRWFILDIPPSDHPKWQTYHERLMKGATYREGKTYEKKFDEWALVFLDRYDKARNNLDQTNFRVSEFAKMIRTQPGIIRRWTEIGVEGYGKLPKIIYSDDKKALKDKDSNLYMSLYGRLEYYYANKDIRRFFKKELADPTKKFKTIDDAVTETNINDLVESHGYYTYDINKVSPVTYDGFLKWINDNVWIRNKKTRRKEIFVPTARQRLFFKNALELNRDATFKHRFVCASWPRGDGKCNLRGSKVNMFNGTLKKVEDIKVGDLLMGEDSKPKKVLSLARGIDEMFEVVPERGKAFVVNKAHILSLKRRRSRHHKRGKPFKDTKAGQIVDISVEDYLKQNQWFKEIHLLYRVPVEWDEKPVNIDPYFLGVWLGDGTSKYPSITTMDKEIIEYVFEFSKQYNVIPRAEKKKGTPAVTLHITNGNSSILRENMRGYDLLGNKHIPLDYKANSREIRLKLLAGLIDTDGYRNRNSIEITQKSELLANDIAFLARSLGFYAEVNKCIKTIKSIKFSGTYYRVGISGDCSIIPTRIPRKKCKRRSNFKDILVTKIKEIRPVGIGEYYGFTLDGNGRYLMEDFTVTHNSLCAVLLFLFRFFNLPEEQIFLVANSEKQTTHLLFNEAKKVINDSQTLGNTPGLEVQQKGIFLMAGKKETYASIEVMSVESGARSNATCFAFSEIHKLADESNFSEIYSSIRGIPNGWVLIESTVAPKGHVFHRLYELSQKGTDPLLYFDFYADEHHNPNITQAELASYEVVMLPGDFNRFFRNRWEDAATGLFDEPRIIEMGALGIKGDVGPSRELKDTINRIVEIKRIIKGIAGATDISAQQAELLSLRSRIDWVDDLYKLPATAEDIDKISSRLKSDLIIGIGIDRARHVAKKSDRTAVVTTAKAFISGDTWMAFVLDIFFPLEGDDEYIKERIMRASEQYGYISQIDIEEYQGKDLEKWCNLNGFPSVLVSATYKRQEAMFPLMYALMQQGLYKCPAVPAWTDEDDRLYNDLPPEGILDIYRAELGAFEHVPPKNESKVGRFGSQFKHATASRRTRKGEPKDDSVYAAAHSLIAANTGDIAANYGKGGADFANQVNEERNLGDYR